LGGHMGAKLSDIPAVKGSIWSVSKKGQQFYKLKLCKLRPKKAQGIKGGMHSRRTLSGRHIYKHIKNASLTYSDQDMGT